MSFTFVTLTIFFIYLFPVILIKVTTSISLPIHTGAISIVDEIRQFSLIPLVAFTLTALVAHHLSYAPDPAYLLYLLSDFPAATQVGEFSAFVRVNMGFYGFYLMLVVISGIAYYSLLLPNRVVSRFLDDHALDARSSDHFKYAINVAKHLLKPAQPIVSLDLMDSSNHLYEGRLLSFKETRTGVLESLVLTDVSRVRHDGSAGTVRHIIPGEYMFFPADKILNVNFSFWGTRTPGTPDHNELFVRVDQNDLEGFLNEVASDIRERETSRAARSATSSTP